MQQEKGRNCHSVEAVHSFIIPLIFFRCKKKLLTSKLYVGIGYFFIIIKFYQFYFAMHSFLLH